MISVRISAGTGRRGVCIGIGIRGRRTSVNYVIYGRCIKFTVDDVLYHVAANVD